MKIFIDAGHNHSGYDTGARGCGLKEEAVTFSIAEKLKALFEESGHMVKMSREQATDNVGSSLSSSIAGRWRMANSWGADLFISIHCNAFDGTAQGTETLLYSLGSGAKDTAERVQKAIVSKLGTVDRGIKVRPDLGVLRHTAMPAMLIETAFIDNAHDAELLKTRAADFAQAIFCGVVDKKEEQAMAQTVMKLPEAVYIQEIAPADFDILVCDTNKRGVEAMRYFNAGFFTVLADGSTIPVGNLAGGGGIISQAKDNPDWINVAGKALTTIYSTKDGACGMVKADNLEGIAKLKAAVSGIPIIRSGKYVSMEELQAEGYFGNELYDTWHGFLGIRSGKLCYVAMRCGFSEMCWAMAALGIYDAIKLDGGGSFILHDGKELIGTGENRRIHNTGVWNG